MSAISNILPWASKNRDRFTYGVEYTSENHVTKFFTGNIFAEYTKAKAMEVALAGTPFRVPRALCFDYGLNCVEFEYIKDAISLQFVLENAFQTRRLDHVIKFNENAAMLLGTLHIQLSVPNARRWLPPDSLISRATKAGYHLDLIEDVFLHCDFSPMNLLIGPDDQITVIDPSPNSYFTDYACLKGNRLVDIATYTTKLLWPFRLSAYSVEWRKFIKSLREDFVNIYEFSCGRNVDRNLLKFFEDEVLKCFVEWKTKHSVVQWSAEKLGRVVMNHARR